MLTFEVVSTLWGVHHCSVGPPSTTTSVLVSAWLLCRSPLLLLSLPARGLLPAGSSGVQCRSSWTSAVTSPQAPSLGLDLLVSCVAPLCDQGLQMQVCSYYSGGSGQSCICKAPGNRKALVEAVICHGSTHRLLKKQVNTVGAIPWC